MSTTPRPKLFQERYYIVTGDEPKVAVDVTPAQARKLGYLISTTSVLKIIAKPGLDWWRLDKSHRACFEYPPLPGETIEDYCRRTKHIADAERRKAADLGTLTHEGIEAILAGDKDGYDATDGTLLKFAEWREVNLGEVLWVEKILFDTTIGSAGRAAFSPDGKRVLMQNKPKSWRERNLEAGPKIYNPNIAKIWDAETGKELLTLKGRNVYVSSAAFSPDGKRVVAGGRIWDAKTGQELLTIKDAGAGIGFSPDGKRVLSWRRIKTVKIWDAVDWTLTREEFNKQKRERYQAWLKRNQTKPKPSTSPKK